MSGNPVLTDRLDSWKEIAGWLGRTVRTAIRWEKERGLPVHRVPGGGRHAVFAYRRELEAWLQKGGISWLAANTAADPETISLPAEPADANAVHSPAAEPLPAATRRIRLTRGRIAAAATLLLGLPIILGTLRVAFPPDIRGAGEILIADVSNPIDGLVAGGGNLYFGLVGGGRTVLMTLPEAGGPMREIPTPFLQTEPVALSPDGKEVLVLSQAGQEMERPLWTVPVSGGDPARVGQFLCHAAAWSPDGHALAYASGNSIYLTTDNGASDHLLHSFGDVPRLFEWSRDGRSILVLLSNQAEDGTLWKLRLDAHNPLVVESLTRLTGDRRRYDTISPPIDDRGDLVVVESGPPAKLWLVRNPMFRRMSHQAPEFFARVKGWQGGLPLDSAARQLYFVRNTVGESELDRYDPGSSEVHPFLPGMSVHDVDFSPDDRHIAFVKYNPDTLWVARRDGSEARQLDTKGILSIELPRWSPDGKELAFLGRRADAVWRIFLVSARGGGSREASQGTDNQGAPTWSADGQRLIYGRVLCQEQHDCAIAEIDLATRQEHLIAGSEGLSTARWSPDGRYIAALRADAHQVFLEDRTTGRWYKLAGDVNGNDLAWARDSRSVYASQPDGQKPSILRIGLDGTVQTAVDLSAYSHLSGRLDTWFTVAPDGSIIFARVVSGAEIVGLSYTVR